MKSKIIFWSVFLLLQAFTLKMLLAVEPILPQAYLLLHGGSAAAQITGAKTSTPGSASSDRRICADFLPAFIAEHKTEDADVVRQVEILFGASLNSTPSAPVKLTPTLEKALHLLRVYFAREGKNLDRLMDEAQRAALSAAKASFDEASEKLSRSRAELQDVQARITQFQREKSQLEERKTAAETRLASIQPAQVEAARADINAMLGEGNPTASKPAPTAADEATLRANIQATVERLAVIESSSQELTQRVAALDSDIRDLPEQVATLETAFKDLVKLTREELFMLAIKELGLQKANQQNLEASAAAKAADARKAEAAAQKRRDDESLAAQLKFECYVFFNQLLEPKKWFVNLRGGNIPEQYARSLDLVRAKWYLEPATMAEAMSSDDFVLAANYMMANARAKGFKDDVVQDMFTRWLTNSIETDLSKVSSQIRERVAYAADSRMAYLTQFARYQLSDKEAAAVKSLREKLKNIPATGIPYVLQHIGSTRVERSAIKKLYHYMKDQVTRELRSQNWFPRRWTLPEPKTSAEAYVAWWLINGNSNSGIKAASTEAVGDVSQRGIGPRTGQFASWLVRWIWKPGILAAAVVAVGYVTADITVDPATLESVGNWAQDAYWNDVSREGGEVLDMAGEKFEVAKDWVVKVSGLDSSSNSSNPAAAPAAPSAPVEGTPGN